MSKTFRPMKCAAIDTDDQLDDLKYPLFGTPKIDGIRALRLQAPGTTLSSSLKPIPNKFIQAYLKDAPRFDGELTVGTNFQNCTSGIMTIGGEPDFMYRVFDYVGCSTSIPYMRRVKFLEVLARECRPDPRIHIMLPVELRNADDVRKYMESSLAAGYEGIVIRSASGPYKYGYPTFKEGYAFKYKPFEDSEGTIKGFFEQMENTNAKKVDHLGLTKRSGHGKGFKGKGTLGGFVVRDRRLWKEDFDVGTGEGLTKELRQYIWDHPDEFLGKRIKYKFQRIGSKDRPRIPIAVGFRDFRDI